MTPRSRAATTAGLLLALHALRLLLPATIPAAAGFSPVLAAALFAGAACESVSIALLATLALTAASDLIVQRVVYHDIHGFPIYPGWEWVYASIALATIAGRALAGERFGWTKAAGLAVATTFAHWLLADMGVWFAGGCGAECVQEYTRDIPGFLACLGAAVPTELRLFGATVVFGGAVFALLHLAPKHRGTKNAADVRP